MNIGVREFCREWVDNEYRRCPEPAVVILWGKLFPEEALGPRCENHATKYLGGRYWKNCLREGWAIFDLTDLTRSR